MWGADSTVVQSSHARAPMRHVCPFRSPSPTTQLQLSNQIKGKMAKNPPKKYGRM